MQDKPLPTQQFSLRFLDIKPSDFPMEQLGEFVRLFAELIGTENKPRFSGIANQSTAALAVIAEQFAEPVRTRLHAANDPSHKAYKVFSKIEAKMLDYGLRRAELRDVANNQIIHTIQPANEEAFYTVTQEGEVEGEIVGVTGADDTMHIQVREWSGRILHLACVDVHLSLEIAKYLRVGRTRLQVEGQWERKADGWKPDAQKCFVRGFEIIEQTPLIQVMDQLRQIPGNGWKALENPEQAWRELRGLANKH